MRLHDKTKKYENIFQIIALTSLILIVLGVAIVLLYVALKFGINCI